MDSSVVKCRIRACATQHKIIPFTPKSLAVCQHISQIRMKYQLKYSDIDLSSLASIDGYHSQCYKIFTALKANYSKMKIKKEKNVRRSENPPVIGEPAGISGSVVLGHVADATVNTVSIDNKFINPLEEFTPSVPSSSRLVISSDLEDTAKPKKVCLFCGKLRKQINKRNYLLHKIEKLSTKNHMIEQMNYFK